MQHDAHIKTTTHHLTSQIRNMWPAVCKSVDSYGMGRGALYSEADENPLFAEYHRLNRLQRRARNWKPQRFNFFTDAENI